MRLPALSAAGLILSGLLLVCLTPPTWAQTPAPANPNRPASRYQVRPNQVPQNQTRPNQTRPMAQSGYAQGARPRSNSNPPAGVQPRSAYAPQGQPPRQPVRVASNPNQNQNQNQNQNPNARRQLPPGQSPPPQNGSAQVLRLPRHISVGAGQQNPPAGPVQVQQQRPRRAKFQLTQEEREKLNGWLEKWESEGDQIKNFACQFERWEYDPVFGPGKNTPKTKGYGNLKYVKPDKGHFIIEKLEHFTPANVPNQPPTYAERKGEFGEHWVCDGESVFEYKFDVKKLMVYEIPEEMRGKAISNGPLPFLFGAKKAELIARYDMRVMNETPDQVWLDAWPLRQQDAANFQHVEVILDRDRMYPEAMQVIMPNGKNRMVYIFQAPSVNSSLSPLLDWFKQPRTPLGWEKVIERTPSPAELEAQRQAARPPRGKSIPR